MRVLESGNHLIALAANVAGVEVVPAYPITPQTQVIEMIADLIAEGKMDAEYIPVESEHSACAALVSASLTGVRAFSATSAHGLAYMHEMLHYAAGIRVPVVMVNVNRALGPGWNIWCDHQDSISQRDTGWLQVYVASHQEAVDTVIQAYRITEDHRVLMPLMLNMDAFVLSHTYMDADVPGREEVEAYLPPYRPLWKLDPRLPMTHGSVVYPVDFSETRQSMQIGQDNARQVVYEAADEFMRAFGRRHGDMVDGYKLEDAEHLIVAMGSLAAESRVAVDEMRAAGRAVGLLRVRFFRPFPIDELRSLCSGRSGLMVIDRDFSYGMEGALFSEVKAALYGHADVPSTNLIVGLGGRDVTYEQIREAADRAFRGEADEVTWGDSHITKAHEITREMLAEFDKLLSP
ncbi:MAG: pyruvate ferredoxin oxidoreductase [Actinobacteria bacterium]|nr:pyruvate ferredoxin oxidoreductase [Actinomycetota bacterium]MBU1942322.1 pyruvate ferredoxin oxidoreductase [Actinomycetota bacterium]MBU2686878.1 pyruvate ferredoxin oxidoreductase [Actinomycetota bacterium]